MYMYGTSIELIRTAISLASATWAFGWLVCKSGRGRILEGALAREITVYVYMYIYILRTSYREWHVQT